MTEVSLIAAPSKEAVVKYLLGKEGATFDVIRSFLERTILISAGISIFGNKDDNLLRNSLAASLSIEIYLLWYYRRQI